MDPFAAPPSGPPASADPPRRRRTGRHVVIALVAVGVVGGGVAGLSQFASADRPEITSPTSVAVTSTVPAATTMPTEPTTPVDDDLARPAIDLGDLGIDIDAGTVDELAECLGLQAGDLDLDVYLDDVFGDGGPFADGELEGELEGVLDDVLGDLDADGELGALFEEFESEFGDLVDGSGGQVTVTGPDGVDILDVGENGSITITSDDGDVTVETAGDATAVDLDEMWGEFGDVFESGELFEGEELDDLLERLPQFSELLDELPELESLDPTAVEACLDDESDN